MKFYIRTPVKNLSNRSNESTCTPQNVIPPSPKQKSKPPCRPPHKKKKLDFKCLKKDTINSLNEVEHFLCNFQNICKYLKLYKILR